MPVATIQTLPSNPARYWGIAALIAIIFVAAYSHSDSSTTADKRTASSFAKPPRYLYGTTCTRLFFDNVLAKSEAKPQDLYSMLTLEYRAALQELNRLAQPKAPTGSGAVAQVVELLRQCETIDNGMIECLVVKHGLPFSMSVPAAANHA